VDTVATYQGEGSDSNQDSAALRRRLLSPEVVAADGSRRTIPCKPPFVPSGGPRASDVEPGSSTKELHRAMPQHSWSSTPDGLVRLIILTGRWRTCFSGERPVQWSPWMDALGKKWPFRQSGRAKPAAAPSSA